MTPKSPRNGTGIKQGHGANCTLLSWAAILLSSSYQPLSVELLRMLQIWPGPSRGLEIVLSLLFQLIALMHPECI